MDTPAVARTSSVIRPWRRRDQETRARRFYDDHARAIWATVTARTDDPQLADDIVQECLVRALDEPGLVGADRSRVRAWLLVVARNLAIDHHRSACARREVPTEQVRDVPGGSAQDSSAAVLDRWLVADALEDLSREHREVVVRSFYGGRDVRQLATDLDIPVGTVKSRLHYGLRALQVALQERGVHPG